MLPHFDVSMVVVLLLIAGAAGVLIWFEINSRRNRQRPLPADSNKNSRQS